MVADNTFQSSMALPTLKSISPAPLLISGSENTTINVDLLDLDGNIIGKGICEKLLGVNLDYTLKFNKHLDSI